MAEFAFDVLEQILLRSDVEDLVRCKSVCKSWQSLISCPRFVKAHLKHAYNNDHNNRELGHRRIGNRDIINEDSWVECNMFHIVGSCNGLVCLSPKDVDFMVINPSTREERKLQTPPYRPEMHKIGNIRQVACWGFGYDSTADDYKVVAGFSKNWDIKEALFHVLTLKSNTWKVIGKVNYQIIEGISGIFCGGALHWFMAGKKKRKVIMSLDLSTDELKKIHLPQPDLLYKHDIDHRLGVIEECLCIYSSDSPIDSDKWVLKNNKWELYHDPCEATKYDIAYGLSLSIAGEETDAGEGIEETDAGEEIEETDAGEPTFSYVFTDKDGTRVPSAGDYIRASVFVKSLVSPYPLVNNNNNSYYEGQTIIAKEADGSVEYGANCQGQHTEKTGS